MVAAATAMTAAITIHRVEREPRRFGASGRLRRLFAGFFDLTDHASLGQVAHRSNSGSARGAGGGASWFSLV
jgi:hypothetical protein